LELSEGKNVIVVGSSFIGMEVAAALVGEFFGIMAKKCVTLLDLLLQHGISRSYVYIYAQKMIKALVRPDVNKSRTL
jgi:hypothetical protein